MWKAIAVKELRELSGIAAVALVAGVILAVTQIAPHVRVTAPWTGPPTDLPFRSVGFWLTYGCFAGALAISLGLRQTLGEEIRGTYPFLLHLPLPRSATLYTKLLTGVAVYFVVAAVPIIVYGAWAAIPGTHPSPFFWSMTDVVMRVYLTMPLVYLGTFSSGLRAARWFGTRLLPLAGSAALAVFVLILFGSRLIGIVLLATSVAALAATIRHVAVTRDF